MSELGSGISGMTNRMQHGFKQTSSDLLLMAARALSGSVLGLTVGLVVQEFLGQNEDITLAFVFAFAVAFAVFWRLTRGWSFLTLLVVDLVGVLVGLLLRLYVMVAPG